MTEQWTRAVPAPMVCTAVAGALALLAAGCGPKVVRVSAQPGERFGPSKGDAEAFETYCPESAKFAGIVTVDVDGGQTDGVSILRDEAGRLGGDFVHVLTVKRQPHREESCRRWSFSSQAQPVCDGMESHWSESDFSSVIAGAVYLAAPAGDGAACRSAYQRVVCNGACSTSAVPEYSSEYVPCYVDVDADLVKRVCRAP